MKEDQEFFVGQKAFIRKGDEVLIVLIKNNFFDFPGGKVQVDETDMEKSLQREVTEETGLTIKIGNPFTTWIHEPPQGHRLHGKKIYLVGYICEYISGEITLSDEHENFRWVNKTNCHQFDDNSHYFKALKKYFDIM